MTCYWRPGSVTSVSLDPSRGHYANAFESPSPRLYVFIHFSPSGIPGLAISIHQSSYGIPELAMGLPRYFWYVRIPNSDFRLTVTASIVFLYISPVCRRPLLRRAHKRRPGQYCRASFGVCRHVHNHPRTRRVSTVAFPGTTPRPRTTHPQGMDQGTLGFTCIRGCGANFSP